MRIKETVMENKLKNIEELPRDNRGGYRVPDGYFSELNRAIAERAESASTSVTGGFWSTMRRAKVLAGSLVIVAMFIAGGYLFLGQNADSIMTMEDEEYMMMSLYDVTTADIIDMDHETTVSPQFAEAAIEYLGIYGYDVIEITEQ